jgi:3-dehydroquinate synthase
MTPSLAFDFDGFRSEVFFADGLDLGEIGGDRPSEALFVFDSTTHSLFGAGAGDAVILPPGEKAKTWQSVELILKAAVKLGLGRDGVVIGVGGGVVGDLSAFAASVYMRGCGLRLVPTTLLAMVDAALGGKTGFDFAGYKNLVGTFYPASRLVIATRALSSLDPREYLSGLAEAIKTAIVGDRELLSILRSERAGIEARDPEILAGIVRRCLAVKAGVVEADLREAGVRAVLNLGHTFAHALESVTGFSVWTHGEAVAWGIGMAVRTGLLLGVTDGGYAEEIMSVLRGYRYKLEERADPSALLAAMTMDKKKKAGRIRLALPRGPGNVEILQVDEALIVRALSDPAAGKERFAR